MKMWLVMLSAFAVAGCAALERQQTTRDALRGEVRALAGDIDAVGQSTQDLAARLLAMEQAIDVRLDGIDVQLAEPVSLPVPTCTRARSASVSTFAMDGVSARCRATAP